MKMFNVNTRAIASFVLAIFLAGTCVVLLVWACEQYAEEVRYYTREIKQAERKVTQIEQEGPLGAIATGSALGALGTGVGGLVVGYAIGNKPGAVLGAATGIVGGGIGGGIAAGFGYYERLSAARDELEYLRRELAEAQELYENCLNPPAKYTYTEPNSGYVWEFCATVYGSDSAAYTAYMNFIEERKARGH